MPRLDNIRKNGLIPERRHDAFLLALLLAVGINVAFFAAQALLPHLAALLQALGAQPAVVEEETLPFVLVDPSFLDEPPPESAPSATAAVNREARQEEHAPDDGEEVYRPEGVDEVLMMQPGNPGEIDPGVDSAGVPEVEDAGAEANSEGEESEEPAPPVEELPPVKEPAPPEEAVEEAPPVEETPPEPVVEEVPPQEPVPPVEEPPPPEPVPEAPPEPTPEVVELPEIVPEPAPEPVPEPVPQEVPPEMTDVVDLAMLPVRDQGLFSPQMEERREPAPQTPPPPVTALAPAPDQFAATPPPQARPAEPARPDQPVRPPARPERRNRENTPRPTFRRLGGASAAGGAPPRRSAGGRRADIFDDPYMALLRDRYPEYMTKLGRMLQDSLNRTMVLYPNYYATGQALLFFRISPEGVIEWHETQYPTPGADDTLRSISERTLLEAGPFDPPPPAMLADPAFRRMSLTVNIY